MTNNTKFLFDFSADIWNQTYKYHADTNVADTHYRVAADLASEEKDKEYWTNKFSEALADFKCVPGGRITSNAGTGLHGTTYINCFDKSAKVLTMNGYTPINKVKIGDHVFTHKGRWKKVVNTLKNHYKGNVDKYTSAWTTAPIMCTPEHPFYQGNEGWEDSKDNQQLTILNEDRAREGSLRIFPMERTEHVEDGSQIRSQTYLKNEDQVNKEVLLNEDVAELLGLYFVTGSSSENTIPSFSLHSSFPSTLKKAKETLENHFGVSGIIEEDHEGYDYQSIRKDSAILPQLFNSIFKRYSLQKRIPTIMWLAETSVKRAFIKGVLKGHRMTQGSSGIATGSFINEDANDELRTLFFMTGLPSTKKSVIRKEVALFELIVQKKDILNFNKEENTENQCFFKAGDNLATKAFKKEQVAFDDFVYNISVQDDESYVVNNVVVHNCFVGGPTGEDQDSIDGIFKALSKAALTLKSEGGYGICADFIRPRGTFINGVGVETPGAVEMLRLWDTMSDVITKGSGTKKKTKKGKNKIRKGAMMVTLSTWHPDIEEFITAKQTQGRLSKFNMSVLCSDEFMQAVKDETTWKLIFPITTHEKYKEEWDGNLKEWINKGYPTEVVKELNAVDLWETILKSTYNRNEPGVLFYDRMNDLNNLNYCEHISATNPCVVGDTLIAVADGRGEVSIKELAELGDDVPVYCLDENENLAISKMSHPRITGYKQPIFEITLDDGFKIKCTGNHKFKLSTGEYVEVKDMKGDESLFVMSKSDAAMVEVVDRVVRGKQNYKWLSTSKRKTLRAEHRYIAEDHYNTKLEKGFVVHHIDFDAGNNRPENLRIMTAKDHNSLHADAMRGEDNPMFKAKTEWSEEKWAEYRGVSGPNVSAEGEENGKFDGVSNEELKRYALLLTEKLGHRFSRSEWVEYAKEHGLTQQFSDWRMNNLGGSYLGFSKWAADECGFAQDLLNLDPRAQKTYLKYTGEGYNCKIEENKVMLEKHCEICTNHFWVWSQKREQGYCSRDCGVEANRRKNPTGSTYTVETLEQFKIEKDDRHEAKRVKLAAKYLDLKGDLGRAPSRKEWESFMKGDELSGRLGNNSPFRTLQLLKEYADLHNHRVVSIEQVGVDTVYNGTVENHHNFFMGGSIGVSERFEKKKVSYFNSLNCGEQLLPIGGVCLLGSLNLTQYINESRDDWDYDKLAEYVPVFVRMLDNVNDKTRVPLEEQRHNLDTKRRIGIGYLGYGSALYMMKIKYGSERALELTDKLASFVTNMCYQSSALLAKEKGAFGLYDEEKYLASNFIAQALTEETKDLIRAHGIRNSHLTSIQPTGNSSIYANNASGGLEPVFMAEYVRSVIVSAPPEGLSVPTVNWGSKSFVFKEGESADWKWTKEGDESILLLEFEGETYKIDQGRGLIKENLVEDYGAHILKQSGEWDPNADWAANTVNLDIDAHVDTMKVFAKYIDAAMSKTINIPEDYSFENFKSLYMDMYDSGVIKGGTSYRAGTMTSVLSASGTKAEKEESGIVSHQAPKRPKELQCNVHHLTVKGERWVVFVGLLEGKPYEVFAGEVDNIALSKKIVDGVIIKHTRSKYGFVSDDVEIKDINAAFDNQTQGAITRLTSMNLRHGTDIKFLVSQLLKTGDDLNTFAKCLARALKKYIKEGEELNDVACPACGSKKVVMMEGCNKCMECGAGSCS